MDIRDLDRRALDAADAIIAERMPVAGGAPDFHRVLGTVGHSPAWSPAC